MKLPSVQPEGNMLSSIPGRLERKYWWELCSGFRPLIQLSNIRIAVQPETRFQLQEYLSALTRDSTTCNVKQIFRIIYWVNWNVIFHSLLQKSSILTNVVHWGLKAYPIDWCPITSSEDFNDKRESFVFKNDLKIFSNCFRSQTKAMSGAITFLISVEIWIIASVPRDLLQTLFTSLSLLSS